MCSLENRMNEYLRDRENSDVIYKIDELIEKINQITKTVSIATQKSAEAESKSNLSINQLIKYLLIF